MPYWLASPCWRLQQLPKHLFRSARSTTSSTSPPRTTIIRAIPAAAVPARMALASSATMLYPAPTRPLLSSSAVRFAATLSPPVARSAAAPTSSLWRPWSTPKRASDTGAVISMLDNSPSRGSPASALAARTTVLAQSLAVSARPSVPAMRLLRSLPRPSAAPSTRRPSPSGARTMMSRS